MLDHIHYVCSPPACFCMCLDIGLYTSLHSPRVNISFHTMEYSPISVQGLSGLQTDTSFSSIHTPLSEGCHTHKVGTYLNISSGLG